MKKRRPARFSVTKAVKANARERLGQPRPERAIPSEPRESRRERKYKQTLGKLLGHGE